MEETSDVKAPESGSYGATPVAADSQEGQAFPGGAEARAVLAYLEEQEVDWEHIHLSPQSIWPITFAAGIAIVGAGAVTMWPVSGLGIIVIFIALVNWVQELRHERH
jgi:hypothetical protein